VIRFLAVGYFIVAMLSWPALSVAAERSVTLTVERMICSACAYRVRKALQSVPGVKQATVSLADKTAIVIYDDSQADVTAFTAATARAGFPAAVSK